MHLSGKIVDKDGYKEISSNTFSRRWELVLHMICVSAQICLSMLFYRKGIEKRDPETKGNEECPALADGIVSHKRVCHSRTVFGMDFHIQTCQSILLDPSIHHHPSLFFDLASHLPARNK